MGLAAHFCNFLPAILNLLAMFYVGLTSDIFYSLLSKANIKHSIESVNSLYQTIVWEVGYKLKLVTELSCRFDLIYLMLDKADEQTDRRLAKHIVSLHFENPEV